MLLSSASFANLGPTSSSRFLFEDGDLLFLLLLFFEVLANSSFDFKKTDCGTYGNIVFAHDRGTDGSSGYFRSATFNLGTFMYTIAFGSTHLVFLIAVTNRPLASDTNAILVTPLKPSSPGKRFE